MSLNKAELILHPVRGRILMALSRRRLTTRQIAQMLPDISQASVYRHIAILAQAGVLQVVEEKPVRGLIERVYAFDESAAYVGGEDRESMTPDDYLRYFQTFLEDLRQTYVQYAGGESANPTRDGVSFWGEIIYLSRPELDEVKAALFRATQTQRDNTPGPERLRYYIGRLAIPESSIAEDNDRVITDRL